MKCPTCGSGMQALFTSSYCPKCTNSTREKVYVVDRVPLRRSGAVLYFKDLGSAQHHAVRRAKTYVPDQFRVYSMNVAGPVPWKLSAEWPWAGQHLCTVFEGNEVLNPVELT
jgi:uncharacterized protein (UPF0212 family)